MDSSFFEVQRNGVSPAQNMVAYLGGSAFQTVGDNPVTAYRQLVQQYAKNSSGCIVNPQIAAQEARTVFRTAPIAASMSGLWPRLIGVLFKRVPKFGILLGYTYVTGDSGDPGFAAATAASIISAPFINPVRMIEKQQRAFLKESGGECAKSVCPCHSSSPTHSHACASTAFVSHRTRLCIQRSIQANSRNSVRGVNQAFRTAVQRHGSADGTFSCQCPTRPGGTAEAAEVNTDTANCFTPPRTYWSVGLSTFCLCTGTYKRSWAQAGPFLVHPRPTFSLPPLSARCTSS